MITRNSIQDSRTKLYWAGKTADLLQRIGLNLRMIGVITEVEVRRRDHVHAFFRVAKDPGKVINIETYPTQTDNEALAFEARILDRDRMLEFREQADYEKGIGREHEQAQIEDLFDTGEQIHRQRWNSSAFANQIANLLSC